MEPPTNAMRHAIGGYRKSVQIDASKVDEAQQGLSSLEQHSPSTPGSPAYLGTSEKDKDKEKDTMFLKFVEESPIGSYPDPPPAFPVYRPFWLMKVWVNTMTKGGYLTQRIYVPPSLWYQGGCKFSALQTKISSCETLLEAMSKLKESEITNTDLLIKELDVFCSNLDVIQNGLHFHLSFIAEIKIETKSPGWGSRIKKLGGVLAKSAVRLAPSQREEGNDYIQALQTLFEEAQFFVDWLDHFNSPVGSPNFAAVAILSKIRRVSDFFWSVICAIVIRDFNALLERYMRKSLTGFVKLHPKP